MIGFFTGDGTMDEKNLNRRQILTARLLLLALPD